MSGSVKGYILLNLDGRPITNRFGAATLIADWDEAEAEAEKNGGQNILTVRAAPRRQTDSPRRGRPRKQQEE